MIADKVAARYKPLNIEKRVKVKPVSVKERKVRVNPKDQNTINFIEYFVCNPSLGLLHCRLKFGIEGNRATYWITRYFGQKPHPQKAITITLKSKI